MKLSTAIFSLGSLLQAAAPLQAATELTGEIPVELARTLLDIGGGINVRLFSDLPDDFPAIELPPEVEIVASVDQSYLQRVLLRPTGGVAVANAALLRSLEAAGWTPLQRPNMMVPPQTGFVAGPPLEQPQMFCGSGGDMLQLSGLDMAGVTVFQLSRNLFPPGAIGPCNPPADSMVAGGRGLHAALQEQMPRLELPPAMTRQGRGLRPAGSSGSMFYLESSASADTDLSLQELFAHFGSQIETQGWAPDTNAIGRSVSTGIWHKQPEPDLELIGILTVVRNAENAYELGFRVQQLGVDRSGPTIGIGIRGMRP